MASVDRAFIENSAKVQYIPLKGQLSGAPLEEVKGGGEDGGYNFSTSFLNTDNDDFTCQK